MYPTAEHNYKVFDYKPNEVGGIVRFFPEGLFGIIDQNCYLPFLVDSASPLGVGNSLPHLQSADTNYKLVVNPTSLVTTLQRKDGTVLNTWTPPSSGPALRNHIYLSTRGDIHAGGL